MAKQLLQIAIDGPASSGKSTVAQAVAKKLNITYISTGRIFRSYAYALQMFDPKDAKAIEENIKNVNFQLDKTDFYIDGNKVTNEIVKDTWSLPASIISAYPFVREQYKKDIQKVVESLSVILDGRDIGTVIIPDAKYKFFLDADVIERCRRRAKDNGVKPNTKAFDALLKEIKKRDEQDTTRKVAPLKKAKDAIYIDSTNMTKNQVVDFIVKVVRGK